MTALIFAAIIGHTETTKSLIAVGAKLDVKDDQQMTALVYAA